MRKSCTTIKNNYDEYLIMVEESKIYYISPIELSELKGNHKSIRTKSINAVHSKTKEDIAFTVESDITNHKNFKFKLFCKTFPLGPFFRFDSDGAAHKNTDATIPLEEQQIATPHFHKFNKNGKEIAYQTAQLKNPADLLALEDINLCAAHFCIEANLNLDSGDLPEIIQVPIGEIQFNEVASDPMNNIDFK